MKLRSACYFYVTVALILVGISEKTVAHADAATPEPAVEVSVNLQAAQGKKLSGLPVRVFREAAGGRWALSSDKHHLNRAGELALELAPGTYRFEVLAKLRAGDLLCVRSPVTTLVPGDPVDVQLPAVVRARVTLGVEGKSQPITQLVCASLGGEGLRWESPRGSNSVSVLAVEDDPLTFELIGGDKATVVAGWLSLPVEKKIEIDASAADWHSTTLRVTGDREEKAAPRLRSTRVDLHFPSARVRRVVNDELTVWSNHRVAGFRYQLAAANGSRLTSRGSWLDLAETRDLTLLGPLQAEGWAAIAWKDWKWYLRSGVSLVDDGGREIDIEASDIDWRSTVQTTSGEPAPGPEEELSEERITALEKSLVGKANWNWGDKQEFTAPLQPLAKFDSENFTLFAPAAWRHRATIYLGYLEQMRRACLTETGLGGPERTEIRWRLNTHNASALVGGSHPYISMPHQGLIEAEDPFKRPWFMSHEMLHTFGYNHGEEMDRLTEQCEQYVAAAEWPPEEWDHMAPESTMTLQPEAPYRLK